jgi:hypothetical protein
VFVFAEPGIQEGGVFIASTSQLWGVEGNFLCNLRDCRQTRWDLLAGFRYLDLHERLTVNEATLLFDPGTATNAVDEFDARNQYYGWQLGLRSTLTRGRLSLISTSKLALGFTHQVLDRRGSTTFFEFGPDPITVQGAQLVLPGNYGRDTRDKFAVLPAGSIQVAYQVTKYMTAFIGYEGLYLSDVVRPGANVDRVLDPQGLPLPEGPGVATARPSRGFETDDFWASAVQFGLGFRY